MSRSFDKTTVIQMLVDLSQKDRKRRAFGTAEHDYRLNPPVSASVIEEFEIQHGIKLPEDYRCFVTEIGNGGAGPYYGVFPFGQHDDSLGLRSWEDGDLVGNLSRPFPHVEAWNLPESFWDQEPDIPPNLPANEEDRLWEAWDKVEQEHYWNPAIMNGAIPICHIGCALRQWLVVNGKQKGFVWNDYRADHRGIQPVVDESGRQMDFSDWYMSWLNASIQSADLDNQVVDLLRRGDSLGAVEFYKEQTGRDLMQAGRAVEAIGAAHGIVKRRSRRRDLLVALMLIAVGGLLGFVIGLCRR